MEIIKELREYGFSEKEALVYYALLVLGNATVNEIAEKTDLIRTTTYDIIKVLKERGFVASMTKNKILHFEAHNPQQLVEALEDKKKKIQKIIPQLSRLKEQQIPKPTIELFEGVEGMKTVFREILSKKDSLYAYSNNKEMLKILPFFAPNFIRMRVKAGIPIKILSEQSSTTKHLLQERDKKELRETKILHELEKVPINQYIFGDSIAVFGAEKNEPFAIIIKHKKYAESQRIIFESLWNKL